MKTEKHKGQLQARFQALLFLMICLGCGLTLKGMFEKPFSNVAMASAYGAVPPDLLDVTHIEIYSLRRAALNAPERMKNYSPVNIGLLLGAPYLERRDGQTHVWQFRSASCVADFYFRDTQNGKQPELTYIETRATQTSAPIKDSSIGRCLKTILSERTDGWQSFEERLRKDVLFTPADDDYRA